MSWSTMSPKDRRAIILGAVIVLPALFFIWGVRPYRTAMAETRAELEAGRLGRWRAGAARRAQAEAARLALSREKAAVVAKPTAPGGQQFADSALILVAPRLFEGRDDAIASA